MAGNFIIISIIIMTLQSQNIIIPGKSLQFQWMNFMECNRGINLAFRLDFTIPSRFARLSTYTIIYNTQRTNPTNQHRNIASVKPWPPGDGGFARASTFNVDKAQLAVDHHRTTPSRKKLCPQMVYGKTKQQRVRMMRRGTRTCRTFFIRH